MDAAEKGYIAGLVTSLSFHHVSDFALTKGRGKNILSQLACLSARPLRFANRLASLEYEPTSRAIWDNLFFSRP